MSYEIVGDVDQKIIDDINEFDEDRVAKVEEDTNQRAYYCAAVVYYKDGSQGYLVLDRYGVRIPAGRSGCDVGILDGN